MSAIDVSETRPVGPSLDRRANVSLLLAIVGLVVPPVLFLLVLTGVVSGGVSVLLYIVAFVSLLGFPTYAGYLTDDVLADGPSRTANVTIKVATVAVFLGLALALITVIVPTIF